MISILIENNEKYEALELDASQIFGSFVLSMKETDVNDPTSIFTNYSKTFSIPGTPRNQELFNYMNRLDSDISNNIKYNCVINNNGLFVDRGYIRITDMTLNEGDVTFNATFYSQLCLFFNNLKTDSEGENRTMDSLIYGLPDEENFNIYWNADNCWDSLNNLNSLIQSHGVDDYSKYITPQDGKYNFCIVPAYNGYYDDFDNDKVLCYEPQLYTPFRSVFSILTDGSKGWDNAKGWNMFEMPRELGEFEIRDFRVKKQHIGIKNSLIINAICDPQNNGGYEVVLDPEFYNEDSKWYDILNRTWCVVDPVDMDNYEGNSITLDNINVSVDLDNINKKQTFFAEVSGSEEIDISSLGEKRIKIPLPGVELASSTTQWNKYLYFNYTYYKRLTKASRRYAYGGLLFKYTVQHKAYGDWEDYISSKMFLTSTRNNEVVQNIINISSNILDESVRNELKDPNLSQKQKYFVYNEGSTTYRAEGDEYIEFVLDTEDITKIRIQVEFTPILIREKINDSDRYEGVNIVLTQNGKTDNPKCNKNDDIFPTVKDFYVNDAIIYDSDRRDGVNDRYDKKTLFSNLKCTPLQYLLSFTKLLGLKFYYGLDEKIYIMTPEHYFTGNVVNIDDKVDIGSEIKVNYNYNDNKYYTYKYNDGDTYVEYLIDKKTGDKPNKVKKITNAEGSEEKEVFENLIWTVGMPYVERTPYFNSYSLTIPTVADPSKGHPILSGVSATVHGYNVDGSQNDNAYQQKVYAEDRAKINQDIHDRICFFDKDYKPVEDSITLLYICGRSSMEGADLSNYRYMLSDDIPIIKELNSGKECHLTVTHTHGVDLSGDKYPVYSSMYSTEKDYNIRTLSKIPMFNVVNHSRIDDAGNMYSQSTLFTKPNINFFGSRIDDWSDYNYIYDSYIKDTADNYYDNEQRELSCSVKFSNVSNINDVFRNYYYFKNSLWILTSISELSFEHETNVCKCTFLKVCKDNLPNLLTNQ